VIETPNRLDILGDVSKKKNANLLMNYTFILTILGVSVAQLQPVANYPLTTDNTCGPVAKKRCPASVCCSTDGWCGTTPAYCQAGCQPLFGTCGTTLPPSGTFPPVSRTVKAAVNRNCISSTHFAMTFVIKIFNTRMTDPLLMYREYWQN
jgi:hypothetical protein